MTRECLRYLTAILAIASAVTLADAAWAQRGGGGRGFGRLFDGMPKAQLATLEQVQTELKMTDEQKDKTDEINDQLRKDLRGLFGSSFEHFDETLSEMQRLSREASEKVDQLLDDSQKTRLQQISIQVNGAQALSDPAVVAQLKLSDEQKTELAEIRAENIQAATDLMQLPREERREKMGAFREEANERLLGVLSDEQKTQFDEMKGMRIDIDMSLRFGRDRRN